MKKVLIMPYFGTLPEYFNLWLSSCSYNNNFDFLVFTDNEEWNSIPENVKWIKISFNEFKSLITEKLPHNIKLKKPYKLCDFRPLYGHILESYISEYDFWGYCDCDTIWGNIGKFLNEDIFNSNDKLLKLGHLSFVRNRRDINELPLKHNKLKTILRNDIPYAYDEIVGGYYEGLNGILINNGYKIFANENVIADVDYHYFNFKVRNEHDNIFSFNKGELKRYYYEKGKVIEQEMMYVHLQKRNMKCERNIEEGSFEILPNMFKNIDKDITVSYIKNANQYNDKYPKFNFKKERKQNFSFRIKRFLYEPQKIEAIKLIINKSSL